MSRWKECKELLRARGFSNKFIRDYFNISSSAYGYMPAWQFAQWINTSGGDGYAEVLRILRKVYG